MPTNLLQVLIIGWSVVTNQTDIKRSQDTNGTVYENHEMAIIALPVFGYERDGVLVPLNQPDVLARFTNSSVVNLGQRPKVDPSVQVASAILATNRPKIAGPVNRPAPRRTPENIKATNQPATK